MKKIALALLAFLLTSCVISDPTSSGSNSQSSSSDSSITSSISSEDTNSSVSSSDSVSSSSGTSIDMDDDEVHQIYKLYQNNGGTLSFDEWLSTVKGEPGKDGASVRSGSGAPSAALGNDGDSYIDYLTFDFYYKEDGVWTKKGNLKGGKGDQGEHGDSGQTGSQGAKGASFFTGTGAPSVFLGKNGDTYLDLETLAVYQKKEGKWTFTKHFIENQSSSQVTSSSSASSTGSSSGSTSASSTGSTSNSSTPEVDSRWNVNFNEYGATFRNTLSALIQKTSISGGYDSHKTIGPKIAAWPNENSNTFIPFYKEPNNANAISSEWDGGKTWNREHVWPNSRGGGSYENDPILIRPASAKDNSSRGNKFYGTGSSEWDPASCGYEDARGEAARAILYGATAYYSTLSLSNNPSDAASEKTMGTLKTLLAWNRAYQPSEFEKTKNERIEKLGYRRNPFVDHPEYADYIWDDNGLRTSPYAGGTTTSQGTVSSSTSQAPAYTKDLVKEVGDLDGHDVALAYPSSATEAGVFNGTWNDSTPWYIKSDSLTLSGETLTSSSSIYTVRFTLQSNSVFTITVGTEELYAYTSTKNDKNYYSISVGAPAASENATNQSNQWTVSISSQGAATLSSKVGSSTIYLSFTPRYGTFSGTTTAQSGNLRLYI